MTTETVNKTIRCKIRIPSKWKQDKIDSVINAQRPIAQKEAELMPSVDPQLWGNIRNSGIIAGWHQDGVLPSTDMDLYAHDRYHGVGCAVTANFLTAREKNEPCPTPESYEDWSRFVICDCTSCKDHVGYEENDGSWGVRVSMHTPWQEGRVWFRILAGGFQREVLDGIVNDDLKQGKAEIHSKDDAYYLHQSYSTQVEVYEDEDVEYVAGVDLGLKNIAVLVVRDLDGQIEAAEFFNGGEVRHYRERMHEKRQEFREAGREDKVKELRDREHLFVENRNHNVSRRIVDCVADLDGPAKIVLEDLNGYRDRLIGNEMEYSSGDRRVLHSWPFRELQDMIAYKAREEGIPVEYVDPRNTSQICNKCGEQGERDGDDFYCRKCDYEVNADFNGAVNIAARA